MENIIIIAHIIVCVLLVGIILLQQGKGAEAGASFGSGASQTVLGATGSTNILVKITSLLVVAFFVLSFALAYFASHQNKVSGQLNISQEAIEATTAPAVEAPAVEAPASDVPNAPAVEKTAEQKDSGNDAPSVPSN